MPGLGASLGRGAATTFLQDLGNSDCILIMGSNMAEAHPVGFRWPMRAKAKGAKLIHVDPRFTRTSAMMDRHVQIRAGSDIAFLGGLISYVLENERYFREYVVDFTNAALLVDKDYEDTEDLDGVFSGLDRENNLYSSKDGHWGFVKGPSAQNEVKSKEKEAHSGTHAVEGGASTHNEKQTGSAKPDTPRDETLQDPRCVLQMLKRHYARYTPEMVADICGCKPEEIVAVAEALCENSGRERTSAICYAVGWTQHSTGVQIIRASTILQLLLGNIGRPGGGIMALRGHASIQGSTDIPTLYDLLPGYLPQPTSDKTHDKLKDYIEYEGQPDGYWCNFDKFIASILKAWYGDAATPENDFHYDWLARIDGDYSMLPTFDKMSRGKMDGYFLIGQNPAAGSPNSGLARAGLRALDWLVVADWFETDSALFWKNDPKGPPSSEIKTEVFFLPAAGLPEKEGTLTNTHRLVQWHDKAIDPSGDCRSDLWWIYNLGKRLRALYAGSTHPKDQALLNLTWDYEFDHTPMLPDGTPSQIVGEPDAEKVLKEINGYNLKTGQLVSGFADLKADGSTSCGCWIYSGIYPEEGKNRARSRKRDGTYVDLEWGYAWPNNRRILYNRASADAAGKPWSERKKYLYWDKEKGKWAGSDIPDFPPDKSPDYRPAPGARGMDAIGGDRPFMMKPDGFAWLFAAGGTKDAPFPAHYEPVETVVKNLLYAQSESPTTRHLPGPLNAIAYGVSPDYPIVACTFRVTEHYLSGPMSRFNSWLNELMPAMFIEMSPELAESKGILNGDMVTVRSARGQLEARALVTRRIRPMSVGGHTIHQIGVPFHWGFAGETVGGIANDLTSAIMDPNVSMHEAKVFTCQVTAGGCEGQGRVPTVPEGRWANRDRIPETAVASQPEGHLQRRTRREIDDES